MPEICESGKLARGAPFAAARHLFGAGFRREFSPSVSDNIDSRIIPVVLLATLSVLAVSFIDEVYAPDFPDIPDTGSTSGTPSSSPPHTFFVPPIRDATPPIIISMNTTGNATRTLGDSGLLLFNITFSESVYRVDPTDFVLISNNDTLRVPANATSLNATIYPDQVIPHGNMTEFVIEMEPEAAYDGATISNGTVRFNIEHLSSYFLEVRLTAPDCRTILLHNQTFLLPSELVKPRTIEQLAGSPLAGPWTLNVQNNARIHNATGHLYGLTLDVGPTIVINGTGSNYLVAVNAATNGTLTLGLDDDHNIVDLAGNRLAGGVPVGANNTYVLTEPPKQTCP